VYNVANWREWVMSTWALLGTELPEDRPLDLLEILRKGLPLRSLFAFKKATGMADTDVAQILDIGQRTLSRIRNTKGQRLPADLSDRLFAIASIYVLAGKVFGAAETAVGWMNAPQFALGQKIPREVLASELGRQQVRALLQRIEYGQLA
jgi:putative toxin-antitoxin system antitoxin component (TIGR02293 family)